MFIDPLYFIMLIPAMLLAGWAQAKVKNAYAQAQKYRASSGMSGAEAAQRILDTHGLARVAIERARGFLGDHYDPRQRVLRLSPGVYDGRNLAAVGIAAHEVGHAIQHANGYAPLSLRNAIVPLAATGSQLSMAVFVGGWIMSIMGMLSFGKTLMIGGVFLFGAVVLFQLINLPVEFDASKRARQVLVSSGVITATEDGPVAKVLNAAAMTYVAATISAILTLVYLIIRSGLLGNRN